MSQRDFNEFNKIGAQQVTWNDDLGTKSKSHLLT